MNALIQITSILIKHLKILQYMNDEQNKLLNKDKNLTLHDMTYLNQCTLISA